jgi:hypothetical protein
VLQRHGRATSSNFVGFRTRRSLPFTAPTAATRSATDYSTGSDVILYLSSTCPPTPPAALVSCLVGSNRTQFYAEEVLCTPLGAGQQVFVFVDDKTFAPGATFNLEATRCVREVEPNDSPLSGTPVACGIEGSIPTGGGFADVDFYSLGAWSPGSRVFALADGIASTNSDYDLRVTTDAATLEFDDDNADAIYGPRAPTCDGTPLTGAPAFLRVTHHSGSIVEPYRLYAAVQPPGASASPELEPNGTIGQATTSINDYYSGSLSSSTDVDIFRFTATQGNLIFLGLDGDPLRDGTPVNAALALLDSGGAPLVS